MLYFQTESCCGTKTSSKYSILDYLHGTVGKKKKENIAILTLELYDVTVKRMYFKKIKLIMGSYRHNHRKLLLLQRKNLIFYHGILNKASVFLFPADNSVNLRRISLAYPINVKYDCLAFREDMLLTHSTMIDLFQSKNNSLKSRISVTPTFQRLIKAIRISPGFPGLLLAIGYLLASNSF